jgi:hypothetical protein
MELPGFEPGMLYIATDVLTTEPRPRLTARCAGRIKPNYRGTPTFIGRMKLLCDSKLMLPCNLILTAVSRMALKVEH